ncbi:MAG: hypothetical protein FJ272_09825 [Planctomycetes bacterium]|nr:hypothetical protein [Planctomycetota bacterium]
MLSAAYAQVSPVQLTVQPQTKRRGSGGEFWSYTHASRSLHIVVKNVSPQPLSDVIVRWGIVKSRVRYFEGFREAAFGAEEKMDLKPMEQRVFDTPSLEAAREDSHYGGTYYGDKIIGHGVQVLIGGKVVTEQFVPPTIKPAFERLKPMPTEDDKDGKRR